MTRKRAAASVVCLLLVTLTACATVAVPTQPPQPPAEYLANALDWMQVHSVRRDRVDWAALRREAMAMAPNPHTTADTYPAIRFAVRQLSDPVTYFIVPEETRAFASFGFTAMYPRDAGANARPIVVEVNPGGPAEAAGVRRGDIVESVNGGPPARSKEGAYLDTGEGPSVQLLLRRAGQEQPIPVTLERTVFGGRLEPAGRLLHAGTDAGIGYFELPLSDGGWYYFPSVGQQVIRDLDRADPCGWIVDLRSNKSGDIWTYLAATGPILGEGDVGAFVYPDGTRELWSYRGGRAYWNGVARDDGVVDGPAYSVKRPMAPVAVLLSGLTDAAGELAAIAFLGRPNTRTFGEPTGGAPLLTYHTDLSDGAFLAVGGAYAMDRAGRMYTGPITPDETVETDWAQFGTAGDPVVQKAVDWIVGQPACAH